MSQPAANAEAADRLIAMFQDAEDRLMLEVARLDPTSRKAARATEVLHNIRAELDALRVNAHAWVTGEIPTIWASGATAAAERVGTGFAWTQVHQEGMEALAGRTWGNLLEATTHVADDVKAFIRRAGSEQVQRAFLESRTAVQAGTDLATAIQQATGLATVTYANGAKFPVSAYAETVARTDTAMAYNLGTFTQAREDGFDQMEVFDGECGWTSHDDPDLADGSIRSLADCEEYPLSHPNCSRSFAPAAGGQEVDLGD